MFLNTLRNEVAWIIKLQREQQSVPSVKGTFHFSPQLDHLIFVFPCSMSSPGPYCTFSKWIYTIPNVHNTYACARTQTRTL